MASFGGRVCCIDTSGEGGVSGRVCSKPTVGVVGGGDGTGTCSAGGFVTQRIVASFLPFFFFLELVSAHFLFFGGAVSVISLSTSSLHTFLWNSASSSVSLYPQLHNSGR